MLRKYILLIHCIGKYWKTRQSRTHRSIRAILNILRNIISIRTSWSIRTLNNMKIMNFYWKWPIYTIAILFTSTRGILINWWKDMYQSSNQCVITKSTMEYVLLSISAKEWLQSSNFLRKVILINNNSNNSNRMKKNNRIRRWKCILFLSTSILNSHLPIFHC